MVWAASAWADNACPWTPLATCIWKVHRSIVRRHLQAKGILICVKCGYNLKGQTEPRCPECGVPFDAGLLQT